uniref:Uncharacterized protein n=1 Tax=Octopus bimaculoides TaxID=37653 RepID=A0A0L8I1X0_OCTBM
MHVLYVMNISRFKVLSLILACLYLIKSEEKEKTEMAVIHIGPLLLRAQKQKGNFQH